MYMMMKQALAAGHSYELRDPSGRPLGQVVEPATKRLVGWGEGTVLLQR